MEVLQINMRLFARVFLLIGINSMSSRAVAGDFMSSDFWKHRATNLEDMPLINPGGSYLQRMLPPPITIFLPPKPHKSPVQFWRFRITMNVNKPDDKLESQNYTRPLHDHNMGETKIFFQEHKESEARGKNYDSQVPQLVHAFPFLLNPKLQHHEHVTGPTGNSGEEHSLHKIHEKNGLVLFKKKNTRIYPNKPENITQTDYFMHFSRAWSIDWSSLTMHLIFIVATAFLITISVALCHSAVASTRGNEKETAITLNSLKKLKLLKNSENSNMC